MNDNSYRLVIKTVLNGRQTLIEFDKINPPTFNDTSEITSQPMVSGDVISDHMFRQPQTVSLSGTFSLLGNKPTIFYGPNDRLTNIEETFTKIKNEGIFCTLTTLSRNNNLDSRYMTRKNMVLYGISWTENQSSVDFRFDFKEVLLATINVVSPLYDVKDENLPDLVEAKRLNFTDTLLNQEDVIKYVIKELGEVGLYEPEFLDSVGAYVKRCAVSLGGFYAGAGIGFVAGIVVLKLIIGVAATIPVWGWVVAGVAAIIGGFVAFFQTLNRKNIEKVYGIKKFKKYRNDEKNEKECKRFVEYIGNISNQLTMLNDVISIYGCGEDENQQCIIEIDGEYYNFKFVRNNTNKKYTLTLSDLKESYLSIIPDIVGLKTLDECSTATPLLTTSSGFTVFLFNSALQNAIDTGKTQEEIDALCLDLRNYYIMVSSIDMKKYNETLQNLIINQMRVGE